MISRIVGVALLISLGALGGYLLASNPQVLPYLHRQQPTAQSSETQLRSMSIDAVPDKAQYELQERCAKRAEQIFSRDWSHGSPDNSAGYTQTANYQSHYNPTLHKCFMLETSSAYDQKRPTVMKTLMEVNSNREYGQFFGDLPGSKPSGLPSICYFGQEPCRFEAVWDAMANVYMEEDGTGDLPQMTPVGPVTGR
jgi:hypothetical protein